MKSVRLRIRRTAVMVTIIAALLAAARAPATECTAASGPQRVAVLELYTSQGCDSCPPADQWVSALPARKFGSNRVIPLAFHVDYWNKLGWNDPFSQAAFSARQHRQSNRRGVAFVVTPQLLLNGQDYRRNAGYDDLASRLKSINQSAPRADIRIKLNRSGSTMVSTVDVKVPGDAAQRRVQVFIALYEMNLVTAVPAGENKGKTLRHDFVVRKLVGPLALDDNGNITHVDRFDLGRNLKPQDINLAVFVQHPQSGDILQALTARCEHP